MKKKTLIFLLAGAFGCVFAAGVVLLAVNLSGGTDSTVHESVPEFIMPDISAHSSAESTSAPASGSTAASTAAGSAAQTSGETEPLVIGDITGDGTEEQPVPEPELPETTSASSSAARQTTVTTQTSQSPATVPADTTAAATSAEPATVTTAHTTAETVPELPDNVMLTSNDPLHYIRFEFGKDRVTFEGVYEGAAVDIVRIFSPKVVSSDLVEQNGRFSGSLDISGLEPGYYIIRVLPGDGLMDYVFEMTADGARPLPADRLPAAENLHAAASPLELPEEGVLQNITTSGDREKAAAILARIMELSDGICAGLTDDYDKARALAVWVSLNMYYDRDASENGVTEDDISLEHVLEYHRSVCFGWTNLYSALCQAQGIECYNASGSCVTGSRCFMQTTTADERSHSWNMVVINGRQIWVDTVWDSGNSYSGELYSNGSQDLQYFDITNTALAQDHRVTRFEHRDYFALS